MAPEIAVVIPHYDDRARLSACLAALAPQAVRDGRVETVVVDNATPGGIGEIAAAHPWARVVTEAEKGAAPARNRGVLETKAPKIAFLDCDCIPAPDWVAAVRSAAAENRIVGGRIDVFEETPPPRSGAEAFEKVFAFDQAGYVAKKRFSVTANLVVPRDVWDRTGPFAAGVSEDVDWCHRAQAAGAALVYAPGLAVAHPARADWPALRRKWRRLTAEAYALEGRGRRAAWAAKALLMPASAIVHAPRLLGAGGMSPGEKGRGLFTLFRLRLQRMWWMLGQAARGRP
ncbi:MAG: glycosyltransferase [Paracoccaceae bacterium]|nr:glycosyltransferase [Paracoccaceae bacterium]